MKSASPKSSPAKSVQPGESFKQSISFEQSKLNFASKLKKEFRGQNSCLNEFLKIVGLLRQFQTFDLGQFLSMTRGLDLEIQEASNLFFSFVAQMESDSCIRKIEGCYGQAIYSWAV
jgi:hypothetical protein